MRRILAIILITLALVPICAVAQSVDLGAVLTTVEKTYTVVKGDTLKDIAEKSYGDSKLWPVLWYANRGPVYNPDVIEIGLSLNIYALPFTRPGYTAEDKALIAQAYLAAYNKYQELGNSWTNQGRWVLLDYLNFDAELFTRSASFHQGFGPSVVREKDGQGLCRREGALQPDLPRDLRHPRFDLPLQLHHGEARRDLPRPDRHPGRQREARESRWRRPPR